MIFPAGGEAPLVPAAPCRAAEGACRRAKEGGGDKDGKSAEEWKRGSDLRLVTFSIQSSVFLTPVISTQSTRMESGAFNWSQRDAGLGLQIRYCRIDSILAKAANRFVSWQTQQIFHPGGLSLQARRLDGISVAKSYWEQGTAYRPCWRYFHDISYIERSREGRGCVGGASRAAICTQIQTQQGKNTKVTGL